jgi:hypothetical protein
VALGTQAKLRRFVPLRCSRVEILRARRLWMTHDVMFYRWVIVLVLGTHCASAREVKPAPGPT